MADSLHASVRPFDRVANAAALRRLAQAPSAPWLHTEVARRMGERLEIIRKKPEALIDWWGFLGAGAPATLAGALTLAYSGEGGNGFPVGAALLGTGGSALVGGLIFLGIGATLASEQVPMENCTRDLKANH